MKRLIATLGAETAPAVPSGLPPSPGFAPSFASQLVAGTFKAVQKGLNVRLRVDDFSGLAREMLAGGVGEAA